MAAVPSQGVRTAIEMGIENRDPTTLDTIIRDAGLEQIPLYNAFNPVQGRGETTALVRAKTGLGPDGFAIGATSYVVTGEIYIFGSGIANLPPAYFQLIRACNFKEVRTAVNVGGSSPLTATSVGSGGFLSASVAGVGYSYRYSLLVLADGTTPAQTLAAACFETQLSSTVGTDATVLLNDSINIAVLPSVGIKRLYRTKVGVGASTNPKDYQLVATIGNGVTTYLDILADKNLGQRACMARTAPVVTGTTVATDPLAGGGLANSTKYDYKITTLHGKNGETVTSSDLAAYESEPSAVKTGTTAVADEVLKITVLPSASIKRIYRSDGYTGAGTGVNFQFVGEVANAVTEFYDTMSDATKIANGLTLVDGDDAAIYIPVSEYLESDAMTFLCYLDSRKHPVKSARGTMDFEGETGANFMGRVTMEGVYGASTKIANPTLASNPGAPPQICGIEMQVTAESAPLVDREIRGQRLGISFGRTPGPRKDFNASCDNAGTIEYLIATTADPRMTMDFEVPNELSGSGNTDWLNDFKISTYFAFKFHIGTDARKRVFFTNWAPWGEPRFLAQLVEFPQYDTNAQSGARIYHATFQLTERTGIDGSFLRIRHTV